MTGLGEREFVLPRVGLVEVSSRSGVAAVSFNVS